jgi:Ti-type conjugative transfer relaxase TraA
MSPIAYGHTEIIYAADGSSPSGMSAYISCSIRVNKFTGARYNFSHKFPQLVHHEVLVPEGAPERLSDPTTLWDEATEKETTEDRRTHRRRFKRNAQSAKHTVLALPKECTDAERLELTRQFIRNNYTKFGLAVEFAIHRPDHDSVNFHAHLLVTTRYVTKLGLGKKARELNPGFATGRNGRRFVSEQDCISDRWADAQNQFFAELGLELRVDPKRSSVAALHMGPTWHAEDSGKRQKLMESNEAAARAMKDPSAVLAGITVNKATFTARDLEKYVRAHGVHGADRDSSVKAALAHEDVVRLHDPRGREIYTTKQVRAQEQQALLDAERIKPNGPRVHPHAVAAVAKLYSLDAEQFQALLFLTSASGLRTLIGRAGTGKTRTLTAAKVVCEASGYSVFAVAPTNTAALNLKDEGFASATTLHRALYLLQQGSIRWDARTVIFLDEGGMVDAVMYGKLLKAAADAGSTVIIAGDDRQLSSVQRGGLFSELTKRFKTVELNRVRRQQQNWQREASEKFARGDVRSGLRAYSERGHVLWNATLDDSRARLMADWAANTDRSAAQFIYASTNAQVDKINELAKAIRLTRGEIVSGVTVQTDRGQIELSIGDRVQFYANERRAGIVNGVVGTVKSIGQRRIEVTTDSGSTVVFDPQTFTSWGLGYSGTVYRAQGKTQTRVFALFDNPYSWSAKTAYVAMTRHRTEVNLYASTDIASDELTLAKLMSRISEDAASVAYNVLESANTTLSNQRAELADLRKRMGLGEGPDLNEWHTPTRSPSKKLERSRFALPPYQPKRSPK